MFSGGATFSENSRRDSKKRRRVSERRRVFSRLGVTGPADLSPSDRRRSSQFAADGQQPRADSPVAGLATSDQTKITMKIQFHITLAPENEPLILDNANGHLISPQQQQQQQVQNQKRQLSNESGSLISEVIGDRLHRMNSSTRKRQQLLAMHQQAALDTKTLDDNGRKYSEDKQMRSGSFSAGSSHVAAGESGATLGQATGREAGHRSSTITDGIKDERTMRFLNRQQQHQLRQASGSLTSSSANSLLGQHQTLMASSNNIRQRLEQREHIYFKRDGQRFGHEFTLKLAVDKNYRCLLKVRPLIPLQSITIHGHHVSFVDCSQGSGSLNDSPLSAHSAGFGSDSASSTPAMVLPTSSPNHSLSALPAPKYATTRHQSIGCQPLNGSSLNKLSLQTTDQKANQQHQLAPAKVASLLGYQSSDTSPARVIHQNSSSLTSLSHSPSHHHQKHLLKLQQHNQMLRHFSASHGSGSHLGSQLVYMFDWSASRFEVTKNKARTTVQTVLKFKNGELLSLPLQIKFYQPECRQHLSWGSQLHFIDYECAINSMGQISVDKVQYY